MQAVSDIFLGWLHVPAGLDGKSRDFYVRQLKDWKGSAVIEQMVPEGMAAYGRLCGWTLARAHARSGDRIAISVRDRKIDLRVPESELQKRKASWRPPLAPPARGYAKLYMDHVLQAEHGCDFDFLRPQP
jgi:hypothetical protein